MKDARLMHEWKEPSFIEIAHHKRMVDIWNTQNEEYLTFLELSKRLYTYDAIYLEANKKYSSNEELRLSYASDKLEVLQYNSLSIFLDCFHIDFDNSLLAKYCASFAYIYKEFIKTYGVRGIKLVLTYHETVMTESEPQKALVYGILEETNTHSLEYSYHMNNSRKLEGYERGSLAHLDSILISREFFSENTSGKEFFKKQKISHIPIFPHPPKAKNRFNGVDTCFQKMREAEKSYTSLHNKVVNLRDRDLRDFCSNKAEYELLKIKFDKLLYSDNKNSQRANELLSKEKELQELKKAMIKIEHELAEYEKSDKVTVSKLELIIGALIRERVSPDKEDFGTWKDPMHTVIARQIQPYLEDKKSKPYLRGLSYSTNRNVVLECISKLKKYEESNSKKI